MSSRKFTIPKRLEAIHGTSADGKAWLERLPDLVDDLTSRWSITLGPPYDGDEVSAAWVAPATRTDGTPAFLKVAMPHMEGQDEIAGLRFWAGEPTVMLLEADEEANAMLLERCEPGSFLRSLPETEQDVVIAELLKRLWRVPPADLGFRPLSQMLDYWSASTTASKDRWPDRGLVEEGLRLFEELPKTAPREVLLATDLHAGNVLKAQREPWLVIDPKPFVGDPAYDATQHIFNCDDRLWTEPEGMIRRLADRLGIDEQRIRLWTFARAAADPREKWDEEIVVLARRLAP